MKTNHKLVDLIVDLLLKIQKEKRIRRSILEQHVKDIIKELSKIYTIIEK